MFEFGGLERWNGTVEWTGLDWNGGLEWNGMNILGSSTGLLSISQLLLLYYIIIQGLYIIFLKDDV